MAGGSKPEEIEPAKPRGPIIVTWTIQVCSIMICVIACGAAMIRMKFVLTPVLMAFFLTFLMTPILDILEKRPIGFGSLEGGEPVMDEEGFEVIEDEDDDPFLGRIEGQEAYNRTFGENMRCATAFTSERRAVIVRKLNAHRHHGLSADDAKLSAMDLTMMGKIPHGIACLLTLLLSVLILFIIFTIIKASVDSFAADELAQVELGKESMGSQLTAAMNDLVEDLNTSYGIKIRHDKFCVPNLEKIAVMQEPDADKNFVMRAYVYGIYNAESQVGEYIPHGVLSNTSCDDIPIFGGGDGMPMSDLLGYVGAVGGLLNEIVLVLLLAIYILLERPEGSTFDVQNRIGLELENMVKVYISLKTLLSMATGVLTSIILLICNVKLALIFGLLAFLLNYIPSVGSMIACVLPGPIIFLDKEMSTGKKLIAFLGPASVQLYIGNALEPMMFGAALNLTSMSVLMALVFFAYLWGLSGAVLSVPLLGVIKIVCFNTDHPLCLHILNLIREDEDLDWTNKAKHDNFAKRHAKLDAFLEDLWNPSKAEFTEGDETPEQIAEKRRLQLEEADAKKKADEDANQAEMDRLAASTANQAASGTASADGEDDE